MIIEEECLLVEEEFSFIGNSLHPLTTKITHEKRRIDQQNLRLTQET